jgi:hypothetical protein
MMQADAARLGSAETRATPSCVTTEPAMTTRILPNRPTDGAATAAPSRVDDFTTTRNIWIGGRTAIEVPCSVEIEQTRDTLEAHVVLEGIEVEHGDEVLVHDAPSHIAFGERSVTASRATVIRASAFERFVTRLKGYLQLTELYEVGFQPKEDIKFKPVSRVAQAATPSGEE